MKPPSTESPPPPAAPPPIAPLRPRKGPGLTPLEILLLVGIVALAGLKFARSLEPEQWSGLVEWSWRTGTPEAIQPGIDVITGVRREPPR